MHLKRSTWIASVLALLVLAGMAYAYMGPSGSDGVTNATSEESASPESPQPKVERLLEDLDNGDAPVTEADVKKAKMPFAVRGDSNSPLGTIAMPSIGLQTKFYSGVVDEVVEKGPGHWPGTPLPG